MGTPTVTETHSLYGGTVNVLFYPNSHKYKLEGSKEWLYSVSAISGIIDKPFLKQWAVNCAIDMLKGEIETRRDSVDDVSANLSFDDLERARNEWNAVSQEAKDTGTSLHEYCEMYILHKMTGSEKPEMPTIDAVKKAVSAFIKWNAQGIAYLHSEKLVYSKEGNYVGIFDVMYSKQDGKTYLSDFKTSKDIYAEYVSQTIGYALAYLEEFPDARLDGVSILRFDKETGELDEYIIDRGSEQWALGEQQFKACLSLKNSHAIFEKALKARNS